jgi:uncharacterized membrane protein YhhN
MNLTSHLAAAAYAGLALADTVLVGLGPRGRAAHVVVKPLLMPTLAANLAPGALTRPGVPQTLTAQALSWGGDVALMGQSRSRFLTGVGSFFGAHVAYVAGFRALGARSLSTNTASRAMFALVAALAPANAVAAGRRDRSLALPVGLYGLLLGTMAASAAALPDSPGRTKVQAGAALFLVSDSLLGIQFFWRDEPHPVVESAVMATYTAGQWLISEGIRTGATASAAPMD